MKKYKITYFSGGRLLTKEVEMYSLQSLVADVMNAGINEWEIIKVELLPEAV